MPLSIRRFAPMAMLCLYVTIRPVMAQPAGRSTGPRDVDTLLKVAPTATFGPADGAVREVTYEGASLDGKPTRVSGYYARPASGDGPFPAMLLVHGGGGRAFPRWATLWADRGYVAPAMDLAGHGPDRERLPDGGPDQDDEAEFRDFDPTDPTAMWTYQAIAAVLKGHALPANRGEVDANRVGVTGISWEGYLACIVAGVDDRIKVAVPVYGCGCPHEDGSRKPKRFDEVPPGRRDRRVIAFDPSKYLSGVSRPIPFVNGTNDFAYPLDSTERS